MLRLTTIALIAICGATQVAAQDNSALAALDRRDSLLGWEAVGRVDIGTAGFCTGTLIATDLVLTAAHCLYQAGRSVSPDSIRFSAGKRGKVAVASAPVVRAVAHPGYDPRGPVSVRNVRHDLALLQLAQPIPAAVAAPFAVQAPGRPKEVSVLSYARERADSLSWQRVCRVKAQGQGLMQFDCDVNFGSSGAPVFDMSGPRARIVSIISSGRRDGTGAVSYGMELPTLLSDLKSALRSGKGVLTASSAAAPPAPIRRIGLGQSSGTGAKFLRPSAQ